MLLQPCGGGRCEIVRAGPVARRRRNGAKLCYRLFSTAITNCCFEVELNCTQDAGKDCLRSIAMRTIAVILFAVGSLFCANSFGQEAGIVVNVLIPAHGTAFRAVSERLVGFSARMPVTKGGRQLVVNQIYVNAQNIETFVTEHSPIDILVFDSPEQLAKNAALSRNAKQVVNVCGAKANCPAFVPSALSPDRREAAEVVLTALAAP